MKEILKFLIMFIILTVIIFFIFSAKSFYSWCKENQLQIFNTHNISKKDEENLDEFKINGLGVGIIEMKRLKTESLKENNIEKLDEEEYTTGYASWIELQRGAFEITRYYKLSIFLGLAITIGYTLIRNPKVNKILKFVFGYLAIIIVFPILYNFTLNTYFLQVKNDIISFIIIYSLIFIIISLVNIKSSKNKIENS